MKVLLINPPFYRYGGMEGHGGHLIPLNLCCLAAYARTQHPDVEFKILDAEAEEYSQSVTAEEAAKFSPNLIGITTTTSSFDAITELINLLKQRIQGAQIVLGGPHVSALPERSLRETATDFVVIGEGEITFAELIASLKQDKRAIGAIKGLGYLDRDGHYRQNATRELIQDLDALPFPARDLVNNSLYCPPPSKRVSLGPNTIISTSRGCPHNCGFCGSRSVWGRRVRFRSPESVVGEIQECIGKYGITSINFTDEFFTARKDRVLRICQLMREKGVVIPWVCSARAERLDYETLKAMKESGCHEISFGIESGNPEILSRIDKKLDLNEALQVVRTAQRVGITTHASYILGYLGESVETMKQTIYFAKRLNTDVAAFFIASPLPGSRLYNEALEKGYVRSDATWQDYSPLSNTESVMTLPGLPIETIRYWHRKALKSYYIRPDYILARLTRIRHWYEIRNMLKGVKILFSIKK